MLRHYGVFRERRAAAQRRFGAGDTSPDVIRANGHGPDTKVPTPGTRPRIGVWAEGPAADDKTWSSSARFRGTAAVDTTMLIASALAAVASFRLAGISIASLPWLVGFPAVTFALLWLRGAYAPHLTRRLLDELRDVLYATASAAMITFATRALLYDDPLLAPQGLRQWVLAAALLALGRTCLTLWERREWKRGRRLRRTLIIGAGRVGQLVGRRLAAHPEWGFLPVGFLDPNPVDPAASNGDVPVLGSSAEFERVATKFEVRHVLVAFSTDTNDALLRLARRCEELGLSVSIVPRLFEQLSSRITVEDVGGLPVLTADRPNTRGWRFVVKYGSDRILAALALAVSLPLLAIGGAAIYVSMGRPILHSQQRVGRDGKRFEILKLRTMPLEPVSSASLSTSDVDESDSQPTRVGKFLRATSIDELPQLFNVLRGEMSLIGPRPERPELTTIFEETIHRYSDRYRVKSGITGWAQVHGIGRGGDRFAEISLIDRVEWDNYYIENWSFWLDIKILLMTVAAVLHFRQS
jgi:exopolysaccharide biosynthesis polyprenyl glycosylphosphotransferase